MYGLEAGTYQTCEKPGSCEASEVTIFIAEWCVACETQVPEIMELVTRLGLGARLIDGNSTDPEERRRARHVEWVPRVEYKGKGDRCQRVGINRLDAFMQMQWGA